MKMKKIIYYEQEMEKNGKNRYAQCVSTDSLKWQLLKLIIYTFQNNQQIVI